MNIHMAKRVDPSALRATVSAEVEVRKVISILLFGEFYFAERFHQKKKRSSFNKK